VWVDTDVTTQDESETRPTGRASTSVLVPAYVTKKFLRATQSEKVTRRVPNQRRAASMPRVAAVAEVAREWRSKTIEGEEEGLGRVGG
jgi:hypothetical protein